MASKSADQVELQVMSGGGERSDGSAGALPARYKREGSVLAPLSREYVVARWCAVALAAFAGGGGGVGVGVAAERRAGSSVGPSFGAYTAAAREPDDYLSFLVIGDWGRRGDANQTAVARAMGACAEASDPDFVVSVGDNFYEGGLNSVDDPEFASSFADVYTHPSLQVPWHVILGNHDYGDCGMDDANVEELPCPNDLDVGRSPKYQTDARLRSRDWRWNAPEERNFDLRPVADAHLFFVDTNVHVTSYEARSWHASVSEGLATRDKAAEKAAFEAKLAASDARWKFVFGHHPMRSNGYWGDVSDVRDALEVILANGGVAAYFNGHDHDMQHTPVTVSGKRLHHFTSGAGSKTGRGFGDAETAFERDAPGFAAVRVRREDVRVQFWGAGEDEGLLYEVVVSHPGGVD